MCNPMIFAGASAGASAVSARQNAKAEKASLLYDSQVAENNATLAEYQAKDVLATGRRDEQAYRMQAAAVKASRRAAMAANGLDLTEGSPVDVQVGTDYVTETDVNTIRNNAVKSAWGYRTQGAGYKDQAALNRATSSSIKPNSAAALSLLGSAGQVAGSWHSTRKPTQGAA